MKKLDPTTINWKQGNPKVEGEYLVLHEGGGMSYASCDIDGYDYDLEGDFRDWYEGCDWEKPDINYDNNSISWWTMDGYNAEVLMGKVVGFEDINGYYAD